MNVKTFFIDGPLANQLVDNLPDAPWLETPSQENFDIKTITQTVHNAYYRIVRYHRLGTANGVNFFSLKPPYAS